MIRADELQATRQQLDFFENHIRPLLHARCVKCHGENQQKGNLRLDSLEQLLQGGESGPAAVPGQPAESLILSAVRHESFEMPPDRPLSKEQIGHLEEWIRDGAAWPQKDGVSVRLHGAAFTAEEREFWSLQPLSHPQPPAEFDDPQYNIVDRFVAARLAAAGLSPAPRASSEVLIRRLYFDLLGVPPSLADLEQNQLLAEPDQWSRFVDQLLADSRYGEHWARYWLDIVRYAESDGFRADFYRPDAWRYRDYVVAAFNNDKPYDQFIIEQLAGDEVAPERAEALVATGYLRTYLYEYNQRDARTQWQDILNQVTDVTGEVFLGMGIGCARCHDHKFDPILQEDYYRLQACFGTMLPRDDIPAADLADRERYEAEYQAWLNKGAEIRDELDRIRAPYMKKAARSAIERFPEDIQQIMARPPAARTPLEAQLADLVQRQILFDEERAAIKDPDKKRIEELEQQLTELAAKSPAALPAAFTVADVGARPQPIHLAADPKRKVVSAGGLSIFNPAPFELQPTENSTGQRAALARWIASPDNPLTARVIVNRIWQRHFGTGLVETASDFGSLGGRPSHPQLLDWLASEFMARGWSIKWLQRQILNSATWQMSAFHADPSTAEKIDPGNRLLWRFPVRRLNAEQIRDAMLAASGELQSEQGGPSVEHQSLRRSLYLKAIRNTPEPLLRSLDGVDGLNSIPKRSTTTTPTQALDLLNGDWVRKRADAMARRVLEESPGTEPAQLADTAFRIALARGMTSTEAAAAVQLMEESRSALPETSELFGSLIPAARHAANIEDGHLPPLATANKSPGLAAPFTFVGLFRLNSLYPTADVRTIVSQWDSRKESRGWAVGVTSEKSAYQPRNLILQVVGDKGYEVVASNLRPKLDTPYAVAVSVTMTADGHSHATFFLQPVDSEQGQLETAEVEFKSAGGLTGDLPLIIGGRARETRHRWDGQLDQIAVFAEALNSADLTKLLAGHLATSSIKELSPAAFWSFDNPEEPFADASGHAHSLHPTADRTLDPQQQAVAELCHVLLNANEFVYID